MIRNCCRNLVCIVFFTGMLLSCQPQEKIEKADLAVLTDTSHTMITRYVVRHDGTGKEMEVPRLRKEHVEAELLEDGRVRLSFSDSAGFIEPAIQGLGLPADWMPYQLIRFSFSNPNDFPVEVVFNVYGDRNRMPHPFELAPGETYQGEMSLIELPLTARSYSIYSPQSLHITVRAKSEHYLLDMEELVLVQTAVADPEPVVDEIGQRKHVEWPGKLHGANQLLHFMDEEQDFLNSIADNPELDQYGGWREGPEMKATGFFYVTQDADDRWWFVTPEGHVFWSLGVTGVRTKHRFADVTVVKGREYLFDTIPPREGGFAEAWEGDHSFSFYSWNIQRKYESKKDWMNWSVKRLTKWGMNTLGSWSEIDLLDRQKMPYTYFFRLSEEHDYLIRHRMPDVFDVRWQQHADSMLQLASSMKNDPYLLGYFIDNEAPWDKPDLLNTDSKDTPLRHRWESFLKELYPDLETISQSWNRSFSSWEEVRNIRLVFDELQGPLLQDYLLFETLYADTYFRFVKETLANYDPNHLYLGCRFTRKIKPEHIVRTAGKYMDVMSVNVYRLYPDPDDMQAWFDWGGRPMLIGEHHLPLESDRQFPPKYQAFTAEERIDLYPGYVLNWAKIPFSVGCHWYQYVDQHVTGRAADGENQTVGLVDITDRPYGHMVKAIRIASEKMYLQHAGSK